MADSLVCKAGGALETLVHQFSDPLSFYRELIQNSLDAHSRRIDIQVEHQDGTMVISLDDTGEGMSAEIIDTRLTRLFSSGKEEDLTKIGRFGIGFVSVFALNPDAVVVDTSRDGAHWRVIFKADRSFVRLAREEPVEGTRIRIYKKATPEECAQLIDRSREVIRFWCRHVDGQIFFQGELQNEPFDIVGPCTVRRNHKGTTILVGYPADGKPFIGFYNRGLTLAESIKEHTLPGLAVKIDSRFLEHTLARDGVVQDARFATLMAEVREIASGELPDLLLEQLERRLQENQDAGMHYAAATALFGWPIRRRWTGAELSHRDGEAEGDSWRAVPGRHGSCHICYGPYVADLEPGDSVARFRLRCEADVPGEVAQLDVYDAASNCQFIVRNLKSEDFPHRDRACDISLAFRAFQGNKLEFRVSWHGQHPLWVEQVEVLGGARQKPRRLERTLFRTPAGAEVSLREALAARPCLTAWETGPLVQALEEQGNLVLKARPGEGSWALLEALFDQPPVPAAQNWCLPRPADRQLEQQAAPLRAAVQKLACSNGARISQVRLAHFDSPERVAGKAVPGELTVTGELDRLPAGLLSRPAELALNLDHPLLATLLEVSQKEPCLAAYLLLKLFLRPDAQEDARLALQTWRQRCRKS
ncbi:MAG: hypothetical protein AMXMBFR33_53850 [Candidatus Xenobia bacterium]